VPPEPQHLYVGIQISPQTTIPLTAAAPLTKVFPWLAGTVSRVPSLADEFAMFADETLEWAEHTLAAALEGWPDDDWREE